MVSAANSEYQAPNLPICCQKKVILLRVRPLDHGNDDHAPQSCPFLTPNGAIFVPGAQRTRLCPRPGAGAPSHARMARNDITSLYNLALFLGHLLSPTTALGPATGGFAPLPPEQQNTTADKTTAVKDDGD